MKLNKMNAEVLKVKALNGIRVECNRYLRFNYSTQRLIFPLQSQISSTVSHFFILVLR